VRLLSSPRALVFRDAISDASAVVAQVTNCVGELSSPNVIVFPSAFDSGKIGISYTYTRGGLAQDIIFYRRLAASPADFNFSDVLLFWKSSIGYQPLLQNCATNSSSAGFYTNAGAGNLSNTVPHPFGTDGHRMARGGGAVNCYLENCSLLDGKSRRTAILPSGNHSGLMTSPFTGEYIERISRLPFLLSTTFEKTHLIPSPSCRTGECCR
jgi:hypothetical protein